MMGLILYGVMNGVSSLRDLERLGRLDLGCMWVAGGIAPDHASIGCFIAFHESLLTQDFFESLTRSILKASGSDAKRLAGDGTVIEAACSHYRLLKEEALRDRVRGAREAALQAPNDDEAAQQEVAQTEQCQVIFDARKEARRKNGKCEETLRISADEPEAMVQRLKRGRGFAASYKPSVLANQNRIIVAHAVDASSETSVMAPLLDQSVRVSGSNADELLLDAGYFHDGVIAETLARDISLLCPEGREHQAPKEEELFHKSRFQYDPASDTYRCPAGQLLRLLNKTRQTALSRAQRVYATTACGGCTLRPRCTRSALGRTIKSYPEDETRDALRMVMQQPKAREIFRQRCQTPSVNADPVFP
jgi:hypothetical protein